MPHLELRVTDYEGDTAWRFELRDAAGAFLADHEVDLERSATLARAFFDLPAYLRAYEGIRPPEELLAEAGARFPTCCGRSGGRRRQPSSRG